MSRTWPVGVGEEKQGSCLIRCPPGDELLVVDGGGGVGDVVGGCDDDAFGAGE